MKKMLTMIIVPAINQPLWPSRLAKQVTAGWLPALLLLLTIISSAATAYAQTGSCTTSSFTTTNLGAGDAPFSVTTGDFNRDGKADLATANQGSDNVSVLLGDGTGGFAVARNFGAGNGPRSIITGDFNGDGKADLATANNMGDNVSVLLGDGMGGFTRTDFVVGTLPRSITSGDFNGDGKADLATANVNSDNISVLLGNGMGSFTATNFGAGDAPNSITTGDFNGDGKPDIATANVDSDNVSVLLNMCSSTCPITSFTAAAVFGAGAASYSVTTGDFNKDGKLDMATANQLSDNVSVLLGNGAGGFAPTANYETGHGSISVTTGDFNKDGKPDLATANEFSGSVSVLLGNGTGGFADPADFDIGIDGGHSRTSVTTGDFNGDGKPDLATTDYYSDFVSVLLGNGTGGFAAATRFDVGDGPKSVITGDFNRDGKPDLATANYNSDNISVLLGNGTGGFATITPYTVGNSPNSVITSDFNGDGKLDIATANYNSNSISVLLGDGTGGFAAATNFGTNSDLFSVTAGDFNGDGKADLATANLSSKGTSLLLGNGTGGFAPAANYEAGSGAISVTTGDFNGDGRPDLATVDIYVSVLLNVCGLPKPVIMAGGPTTFCAGDSVILSAPAGYATYRWSNGDTTQSITVKQTGSYTITVSDNGISSPASDPVAVTVNPLPSKPMVTANGPTTFCPGGSVILTATAATSYRWSSGDTTRSIIVRQSGAYSVVVKNSNGCSSPASDTTTVRAADNEKPVVSCAATQRFCKTAAGTYTIPATTATDNCGVGTFSYSITGATTRSGTGANASGTFATGTSTIAWAVSDVNGNVGTCTTTVFINPLPVASVVVSSNNFCNAVTITAQSTLSGPFSYQWYYNNALFATTQSISLTNANGDGAYSVFVTDGNGCRSTSPAVYTYNKQSQLSNYTLLAKNEIELGEKNRVLSGSVGILNADGSAEFEEYSSVASPGAFVKAPEIEVENPVNIPTRIYAVATVTLPPMQYNTNSTNNLPSYTVNQNTTVTLTGNYKNLNIQKGATVTLTGNIFGSISISEGATLTFTATTIDVADLKVGNSDNRATTVVHFSNNTSVRVSRYVTVDENCSINPQNNKLTFYIGSQSYTDGKFEVKKGNSKVVSNVLVPWGKIDVEGDDDDATYMTGLFVADEIESGENVTWNSFSCNSTAAPIAARSSTAESSVQAMAVPAEKLPGKFDVVVMPNPTTSYFTFKVSSDKETPMSIRILNNLGQVVERAAKVNANSNVILGAKLHSGTYMAEVTQGNERKMIRLVKLN